MSQPEPQPAADFTVSLPDSWRAAIEQRGGPAERIEVIEDSLRCYTYGWLSCLPVIGVAYLYPAVRRFVHARRQQAEWNPARGYLAAGLALTGIGWLIGLAVWPTISSSMLSAIEPYSSYRDDWSATLTHILMFGSLPAFWSWSLALGVVWSWWGNPAKRRSRAIVVVGFYLGLCAWNFPAETAKPGYPIDYAPETSAWALASWAQRDAYFPIGMMIWAGWLIGGFLLLALRRAPLSVWLGWFGGLVLLALSFFNW